MKLEDELVELREWDAIRVAGPTTRGIEAGPDGVELLAFGAPNTGNTRRRAGARLLARELSPAQGRLRPNRSCAATHSSATIAEPSDSSPQNTVAAMISANFSTLPFP